jgi:hypothetical protein
MQISIYEICIGMEISICYSIESLHFIDSVKNLLVVDKKVIVVVDHKLQHPLIDQFKKKSRLMININLENRAKVNQILLNRYWLNKICNKDIHINIGTRLFPLIIYNYMYQLR